MMGELIGLVPAAGKGLRLNLPYPKELYPVIRENRYKPVAEFVLDNLRVAGIRHVVVVVNETKHQLLGYFGDGHRFGFDFSYVVQEQNGGAGGSTSPGLASALNCAYHLMKDKTVCFGMPDTIMRPIGVFAALLEAAEDGDDAVMALFPTSRPEKFGMVRLGAEDHVEEVVDKPRQTALLDMWGCMIWGPRFSEHLRSCVRNRGISDFALILNEGIAQGLRIRGKRLPTGSYKDLGTYEEILELEDSLRQS